MTSWTNWAGNVTSAPAAHAHPRSGEEVVELVQQAGQQGQRVRPIGSGHSFTPVGESDGVLVHLEALSGVIDADVARGVVRVGAGTALYVLNPTLQALGLALPNLGDIDRQTISGALATGTHGTGLAFQGIAAAVRGLTLVLADGSLVRVDATHDPELFEAARVGLGAFGIVTEVELQCVPAFQLRASERPARIDELLEGYTDLIHRHDHVDIHYFPHTERALLKANDRLPGSVGRDPLPKWRAYLDDELLSNNLYEVINRISAARPSLVPRLNAVSARALSARTYTDISWKVFCSHRGVRFRESEYAVPLAALPDVLRELRSWIATHDVALPFPIEIRSTGPDDVWLSTGYERTNAYIAVHQYHRMEDYGLFAALEGIAGEHQGRPHWGKLNSLGAEQFSQLYPRFADAQRVRERVDPQGMFLNPYLRRIFIQEGAP